MKRAVLASLILTLGLVSPTFAQNQRWNELANLPFQQGYPSDEMKQQLMDELLFERGVQSYLWSLPAINLPAINMWAMKEGSEALQVLRRNADAPPGAHGERMDVPSPQKAATPINATSNPTFATKSARCRCQGRRHQRPQLDQVPPPIASPVDSGRRCNRRPASDDRFRGKLPSPRTWFVFRP